jgi:hypothetical protein
MLNSGPSDDPRSTLGIAYVEFWIRQVSTFLVRPEDSWSTAEMTHYGSRVGDNHTPNASFCAAIPAKG